MPDSSCMARTAAVIISRGTRLMAGAPTGHSRPGLVTRPTPKPPSRVMPGVLENSTLEKIRMPFVMSGSSPLSLRIAQLTKPSPAVISSTGRFRRIPLGVISSTDSSRLPSKSIRAAALEAAAAQEPVV